ncbi:beta-1,4-galactosyltransferase 1 [Plakobranchus ocellatus]|uniref:Beta-1,4-galactosyltransferase n=1 Tax=Plakobranchus ocellatus TaxID=259542 RepID=A0AAV4CEH0_9GAST|nr:beta-1,4-galactosyltransferase 1 [Plakobranchus ocellatus]
MRVNTNLIGFRYQRVFRRFCRYVPRGWYMPRKACVRAISLCASSFVLLVFLLVFVFSGVVPFQYTSHLSRVAQDFSDWAADSSSGMPGGGRPKYILVHIGDPNSTERGKAYLARGAFSFRNGAGVQGGVLRETPERSKDGSVKCTGVLCFAPELRTVLGRDGERFSLESGAGKRTRGTDGGRGGVDANSVMKVKLEPCAKYPTSLEGRMRIASKSERPLIQPARLAAMFPEVQDGGHFTPTSCSADEKTAIVIPYRDRWDHLHTLLPVLIPMLMRQQIDFTIYVIEQDSSTTFNKGLLFNAAFLEAMNMDNYDCFILHDVDMIPLDDRNLYRCNVSGPIHLSAGTNKFNYSVVYDGLFGGVVSFTREQFRTINGASNMYFGWGAEDDDLRDRAWNKGFKLLRKPVEYGIYDMIRHRYGGWSNNPERYKVFATRLKRQDIDGLNTAVYNITGVGVFPIYTWISVNFDADVLIQTVPAHLRQGNPEDDSEPLKPVTIEHLTA